MTGEVGEKMFRTKRNHEQTHGQLFRAELGESVDHALRAAGYAAGGVKAAVGPAKDRVRDATQRVRHRGRTEEARVSQRRVPRLAGLLAVGALMGAVTAFVLRRRRQQQWDDYDPTEASAAAPEAEPSDAESQV
jgi:hypothetical protein